MLRRATELKPKFFSLRTRAILCIFYLTGKRRSEVCRLELNDIEASGGVLNIAFTLSKKRRESVLTKRAIKTIPLTDPLTHPITEYLYYLKAMNPPPRYLLPACKPVFGSGYVIDGETHIGGRQLLNLVRQVSEDAWPHLFRETAGAEIVKHDPTIVGVFKVKQRLDHENLQTSMRYLARYANDVINREESKSG